MLLFLGYQAYTIQSLQQELAFTSETLSSCRATLAAYLEGEDIDDDIPLDLDGFPIPPEWLRGDPVPRAPSTGP